MIFDILGLIFYAVYSYINLVFRKIFPRPPKSLDGEVFLVNHKTLATIHCSWKLHLIKILLSCYHQITGAGSGIGKAVVENLALNHPRTKLVLWDVNEKENVESAEFAKGLGVEVYYYTVDVTDRLQVSETAKKVWKI